jgi:hypothetical protein
VLCCVALRCVALRCVVLYCIVLYCIVLYCIVLYCNLVAAGNNDEMTYSGDMHVASVVSVKPSSGCTTTNDNEECWAFTDSTVSVCGVRFFEF